jgi:hypothetical protein
LARNPYWREKIGTVDLLILINSDMLLFILKNFFFSTKQPILMRRSTVPSLPFSKGSLVLGYFSSHSNVFLFWPKGGGLGRVWMDEKSGATTLDIMTLGVKTSIMMAFRIMTLRIMRFSKTTLNLKTFSIMTLRLITILSLA